jgi:hypothetical protein
LVTTVFLLAWAAAAWATSIPWTVQNVQLVLPGSSDVYALTGSFTLDVSTGAISNVNIWFTDLTAGGNNYSFLDSIGSAYTPGNVKLSDGTYIVEIGADYTAVLSSYVATTIPVNSVVFGSHVRSSAGTLDLSLSPQLYTPDIPAPTPEPASWLLLGSGALLLLAAGIIRRMRPAPPPDPNRQQQS